MYRFGIYWWNVGYERERYNFWITMFISRSHHHVKSNSSFVNTTKLSVDRSSSSSNTKYSVSGGLSLRLPVQRKIVVGRTHCSTGVCTYPVGAFESQSNTDEEKIGVLLLNLGGPDTLNDVQPFLFNLFADPVWFMSKLRSFTIWFDSFSYWWFSVLQDIIRLPRLFRFLQRPLAQLISVLRAPKSKEGYASIGGGSPLRKITDEQVSSATNNVSSCLHWFWILVFFEVTASNEFIHSSSLGKCIENCSSS